MTKCHIINRQIVMNVYDKMSYSKPTNCHKASEKIIPGSAERA